MTSPLRWAPVALVAACLTASIPTAPAGAAPALPAAGPPSGAHVSSGQAQAWAGRGGGWRGHSWSAHAGARPWSHGRFGPRWAGYGRGGRGAFGWGAFDTGWTAFAPGWAETAPVEPVIVPVDPDVRLRLPTAADLPVAGLRPTPVGPAVLYDIRDLSRGRSGNPGGARIVSASEPSPLPGSSPAGRRGQGGPLIIHLTAR